ncbi:MAG: type II secretion system protein [Phycisphaerae bacterium]|nr:type II secretion system protein [Phycisphaerae bacterium]
MIKKGFTLIELLVVISIIALLVAILMPALAKARETSKALVCETNQKQLITAWHMYCDENNGRVPGSWNYNPSRGWGQIADWAWVPMEPDSDVVAWNYENEKCTEKERQEGVKRGSMYKYTQEVGIYHCPSDKLNFRSYSMPDGLNGYWGRPNGSYWWDNILKRDSIKFPSGKYVFLEECDSRGYNINAWYLADNGVFGDPLTTWHSGASNQGFADGHVEKHKWSDEVAKYFLDYKIGFLVGYNPTTAAGKDDYMYLRRGWPSK